MRATPVTRPTVLPYNLLDVVHLPYRLFNPPPAPCKARAFHISPDFRLDLDDILDNKHLPPLALKDFEEYLLFTEHSAENLYFIMWLREYTRLHDLPVSSQESNKSGDLAILFNRALATFFDPTSHLALNLPHNLTSPLLSTTLSTHPNPSIFNDIEAQVKIMLRDSLARFSHRAFGNADRNRSWFSTGLGIACILIGFVPVIVLAVLGKNRWIRLVAFIWFWLGISAVIAASRGLCLILYSFADARQLYPYELAAPRLPASLAPTSQAPPPSSTFDTLSYDEEQKIGFDALTPLHTASFIPLTLSTDPTSPSPSGSVFKFDFDSLPPATPKSPHYHHSWTAKSAGTSSRSATPSFISSSMTSSPMFGSITRISNPIVRWNQWHIATRSLTFGFVLGAILTAACVAIPPAHLH